ncbi:hypothetical protein [Myroides odoratus]|uniref:Uncharacterized protein n=1 Tax=Myroides odoratus TaxID=256 RepID=A0A9Q6ZD83_MYROD|nr:hypothetical protein [Myroides odoratus]EHQ41781.1 hypothetical protein Myrod_0946 [Myroides odoratus DSM 2801]EKB08990.1 hypothetical protein HMPREF9716_00497 [Myroides odoratus CIP 103059]QQT99184.1 hypothetical protein I6I88_13310 [Myroides odoratus]WQD58620.1 hypothetical protein U0010_05655 [Myroides odoratus]STZ29042.1 Uncharacterised protein [Myroides odoratus]
MKKIITLLFICAFATTTFAHRVLTVRNLSNETKYFYALEMEFMRIDGLGGSSTYAFIGDYIMLDPGQTITFSQNNIGDVETFNFCPAATAYSVIPYEYPGLPPLTSTFRWFYPNGYPPHIPIDCDQFPQLPATLGTHLSFRGFKIAVKDPVSERLNGLDYFIPRFQGYNHPYNIRETFLQLPLLPPYTVEIHEVIFQ